MEDNRILSAEACEKLFEPIDKYVGKIQSQINVLRADGTDRVIAAKNRIDNIKQNKSYTAEEKKQLTKEARSELQEAKAAEASHKTEVDALISDAENFINKYFKTDYYDKVVCSCQVEKKIENSGYREMRAVFKAGRKKKLSSINDSIEKKETKNSYNNRLFEAEMNHESELQRIKDKRHDAFARKYYMLDRLRLSKHRLKDRLSIKWENYKYTFDTAQFFYKNGLYMVILLVFIFLCCIAPLVKEVHLLTIPNILNIFQQASPRIFLALGVAGLILLTGTDLSVGRMVGMGMVIGTIIMHNGINTGTFFGHVFDFSGIPIVGRALLALVVCVVFTTFFSTGAGFFMAKFKMHPFISTMANMLIIFGLITYATKGVSFGAIDDDITNTFIPTVGGFPTIILWAVAAIIVVWFIWNKTTFGKHLYAVGGNPEAAAVSGISVFKVTLGAFVLAGILYGIGSWLECTRMVGSGSAAYGQGWEMDAIAACVVGGISFTGGIGKISGVVAGVLIFTSLTYALTVLGIDTNLQFVFEGFIILAAVTLDCLKYVKKK